MIERYLKQVVAGDYLELNEAYQAARILLNEDISQLQAAALLSAMRTRKESQEELRGFIQALYENATTMETDQALLDTCGTGGDGLGTFNISTAAALVAAGCGAAVAKHGNSAVTGKVGSADVLAAMGVDIRISPDKAREMVDKIGITFLFAPDYHPILRQLRGLRQEMGVATIFNFLGPLLNPFFLQYQVVGISDGSLAEPVARTVMELKRQRALIVHAENGMDEISPEGNTMIYELREGMISSYTFSPQSIGVPAYPLQQIQGGDLYTNVHIIMSVLEGNPGPYRETVALNAAAALVSCGLAGNMGEGLNLARESLDSGKALKILQKMIAFSRDGVVLC